MSPDKERIPACCTALDTGFDATTPRERKDEPVGNAESKRTTAQKDEESTIVKVEYEPRIKWLDLVVQIFIHAGGVYGFYLVLTQAKLLTTVWGK